ncbi:MAG: HEAT repeat domain-containing protein [Planctomycetes bacterium]|nr:HEAT repeat domain-containing protein [Planctomycetota bacterium]
MKVLLCCIVTCFLSVPDLDSQLPPGTSEEVIFHTDTPLITTTFEKFIETGLKGSKKNPPNTQKSGQSGTDVSKEKKVTDKDKPVFPPNTSPPLSVGFLEITGITTPDFPFHCKWILMFRVPQDPLIEKLSHPTFKNTQDARNEVYSKCFSKIFYKLCHNNRTFNKEDAYYLTLIGDPAGNWIFTYPFVNDNLIEFANMASSHIDAETKSPDFIQGKDPYETMIYRFVSSELFSHYPFAITAQFAPGLSIFPDDEIFSYLHGIFLKSTNKRVRRNAVYYLGLLGTNKSSSVLFNILNTTKDNTEKYRALYFLTKMQYTGLEDHLLNSIGKKSSPVLETAIINSLGRIGGSKAFSVLFKELKKKSNEDYEKTIALLKACARCLDTTNEKNTKQLGDFAFWMLSEYKKTRSPDLTKEPNIVPLDRASTVASYRGGARGYALEQILDIILAVCNEKEKKAKLLDGLKEIAPIFDTERRKPGIVSDLALNRFETINRVFLIEMLPKLGAEGKAFLEKLLISGFEHDTIIIAALNTYSAAFPEDFSKIATQMINNTNLPMTLVDKAIRLQQLVNPTDPIMTARLNKVIDEHKPDLDPEHKQLTALAIYYLGSRNSLEIKRVAEILKDEVDRAVERGKPSDVKDFINIRIVPNNVIDISFQVLSIMNSPEAEKFLLEFSNTLTEAEYRRMCVKALSRYSSPETIKRLADLLEDEDPWVRLCSYNSIKQKTGKECCIDWFYSNVSDIKEQIKEYQKLILN